MVFIMVDVRLFLEAIVLKILVWGAGGNGKVYRKYIEEYTEDAFVAFVDNAYPCYGDASPADINKYEFDKLVVSNQYKKDRQEIKEQIKKLSLDESKIVFLFEDEQLKTEVFSKISRIDEKDMRVVWLASFAQFVKHMSLGGNVAECGVYNGTKNLDQYFIF